MQGSGTRFQLSETAERHCAGGGGSGRGGLGREVAEVHWDVFAVRA